MIEHAQEQLGLDLKVRLVYNQTSLLNACKFSNSSVLKENSFW